MPEMSDRAFQVGDPCPIHPARLLTACNLRLVPPRVGRQDQLLCIGGGTWSTSHYLCERAGCDNPTTHRQTFCSPRCRLIAWRAMQRYFGLGVAGGVSAGDAGDGLGVLHS